MLGLSAYRVVEREDSAGTFDFIDPESGRVVGVATSVPKPVPPQPANADRRTRILARLLEYRFFLILFALVSLPILFARVILGGGPARSKESRPRLVVRRPIGEGESEEIVFTLRQSSGFMYDSRRLYDGQGGLIAQFRSRSKTTVRGGFAIVDLRGMADDGSDIGQRPWLGNVDGAGGTLHVRLVGRRDAGVIVLVERERSSPTARADCAVEVAAGLRDDPTSMTLVLAAALTLAWWPPA